MKRITLFLLLALYLSLQAFAQIRIGVDAGMNLTHFKSSDNYVQKIGGMGTGFQIGGTLDYEFKKHWMLMSGVSFKPKAGWKWNMACFPVSRMLR